MKPDQTDEYLRQVARDIYCDSSCDIEIDDDASLSEGEEGTWVMAWVWVPKEDQL